MVSPSENSVLCLHVTSCVLQAGARLLWCEMEVLIEVWALLIVLNLHLLSMKSALIEQKVGEASKM